MKHLNEIKRTVPLQFPCFKFVDRGFKENILLIPGWATDERIFEKLDIAYNYILPQNFLPEDFENKILLLAKMSPELSINLLGWSMGGFIGAHLFVTYPEMFDRLILVSMRPAYDEAGLERVRDYLRRNTKLYLSKFYEEFFFDGELESNVWFKENLLKKYIGGPEALHLFEGLDYLAQAKLDVERLNNPQVTFVHGENDLIAPLEGAQLMAERMPRAKFVVMKNAGHLVFLSEKFKASLRAVFAKQS